MMNPKDLQSKLKAGTVDFMLATPFKENQEVDFDGYKENIRWLLDKLKGFDACTLTPSGSAGEFANLTEEEQKKVIEVATKEIGGEATVVAGTGRASTRSTIAISKYAQDVGADGLQVILPYYYVPMEEGMYEHYKELVDAVDIGVVVYNNLAFSGSYIKPALMKRMVEDFGGDGRIAGVKETAPHLMISAAMVKALEGTGVAIHSGYGEQWFAYQFPWGVTGMATSFGNFYPEFPLEVFKAAQAYDFVTLRALFAKVEPYYAFVARCSAARVDTGGLLKPGGSIYGEGNLRFGIVKEAMNLVGLNGGRTRLPLTGLTQKERDELREILKALGLV